jgi:hypothetical protein
MWSIAVKGKFTNIYFKEDAFQEAQTAFRPISLVTSESAA